VNTVAAGFTNIMGQMTECLSGKGTFPSRVGKSFWCLSHTRHLKYVVPCVRRSRSRSYSRSRSRERSYSAERRSSYSRSRSRSGSPEQKRVLSSRSRSRSASLKKAAHKSDGAKKERPADQPVAQSEAVSYFRCSCGVCLCCFFCR